MRRHLSPLVFTLCLCLLSTATYAQSNSRRARTNNAPPAQPLADVQPPVTPAPVLISTSNGYNAGNLQITYDFSGDISKYNTSKLTYQKLTGGGAAFPETSVPFVTPLETTNRLTFNIPASSLSDGAKLIAWVTVTDAATSVYASPKSQIDLRYYNELIQTSTTNQKLLADNQNLQGQLTKAQGDLNTILEGNQPQHVFFNQRHLVADEKIVVSFTTDRPGRIRATINGPSGWTTTKDSENVSTQHVIIFDGLRHDTDYEIKAEALALKDKQPIPGVSLLPANEGRLKIRTTAQGTPPTVTPAYKAYPDHISVSLSPDQKIFYEIQYREVLDSSSGKYGKAQRVGLIQAGDFGTYTGESVDAGSTQTFNLPDVKESSLYEIIVRAVNANGKTPPTVLSSVLPTPKKAADFNFAHAVNVVMTPLNAQVKWDATTAIKEAFLEIVYDGDVTYVGTKKASVTGNTVTATLETGDIAKILGKDKSPTFRLRMSDGTNTIERDFQFMYIMPTKAAIDANKSLDATTRKALLDVAGKIENKDGINWRTLLTTGLGAVIRTFLPIP